jgi:hypothetical protein
MISDLTGIEEAKTRQEEKETADKQTPLKQRGDQLYLFAV